MPWGYDHSSINDTERWIHEIVPDIWDSQKGYEFVIVNAKDDRVKSGCCSEQLDLNGKQANIAYWVRTDATGRGIATYACHFLIQYGLRELDLEIIRVIPSTKNIESKKVAKKLPYASIELVKNGFKIRDPISDALIYKITRTSYGAIQ